MGDEKEEARIWEEMRASRDLLVEMKTMMSVFLTFKTDIEARVRKLEERRFPLPQVAAITGGVAVIVALVGVMLKL